MNSQSNGPRRGAIALAGIFTLGVGLAGGFGAARVRATPAVTPSEAASAVRAPSVTLPDFASIAARYGKAVVNVSVSGTAKVASDDSSDWGGQSRGAPGLDPDNPLSQFFKRFQTPDGGAPGQHAMPMHGQGSGFIVNSDGIILTNAHVVRGADDVTVKLTDRREYRAKVLGSDPKTDIAVLKIDAKDLPTVPLGSARDLAVGQWVLAIGSPFGFENSVTAGIVSAKGRSLPGDGYVPFIQTDVPVNPGNSGGPLFNTAGEVVGINSQIYSGTGGFEGISFAIPIDVALRVKDEIVRTGHVRYARLGVTVQGVNQTLAESFKLDRPEGALVSNVEPNSPADRAGLKTGDVIQAVDGQAIENSGDLPAIIGQDAPGQTVKLEIWRQGKRENVKAILGDASKPNEATGTAVAAANKGRLGLALRPLEPQERHDAGVSGGLLVEDASGPAAVAGVQPGDVLVAVDGSPVKTVAQVRDAVGSASKSVALLVERNGEQIFIPVRLG